ncbi:hypothetical protein H6F93_12360 [Leptolyngbya sp. FACHB-671]|uniref:hypothetical protein n=1 Tax=Leptolyngbya sp. FACHB-671 TaxID=2692812 RepID=UPI001681FEEE|nr:hypothetical protein [Leptolyngbya sp. FACHB-671]MBD2068304.1 hypothetical protein [Leptolyngbya sp. FACHB-671]
MVSRTSDINTEVSDINTEVSDLVSEVSDINTETSDMVTETSDIMSLWFCLTFKRAGWSAGEGAIASSLDQISKKHLCSS